MFFFNYFKFLTKKVQQSPAKNSANPCLNSCYVLPKLIVAPLIRLIRCWMYSLSKPPNKKNNNNNKKTREYPDMTQNYVWCWGLSSKDLVNMEYSSLSLLPCPLGTSVVVPVFGFSYIWLKKGFIFYMTVCKSKNANKNNF